MAAETEIFRASHRFMRMSPQKARLVMDLIRGKAVEDAITTLRFSPRRASPAIRKVLESAIANATQKAGVEGSALVVWRAFVDDGPRQKRWKPRAQGRAYPRIRRYCHLNVLLKQSPESKDAAKKVPAGEAPAAVGSKARSPVKSKRPAKADMKRK